LLPFKFPIVPQFRLAQGYDHPCAAMASMMAGDMPTMTPFTEALIAELGGGLWGGRVTSLDIRRRRSADREGPAHGLGAMILSNALSCSRHNVKG
jgi:hypothetical protein